MNRVRGIALVALQNHIIVFFLFGYAFQRNDSAGAWRIAVAQKKREEASQSNKHTHTRKAAAPIPKQRCSSPVLQLEHAEAHRHAGADGDEAGVRADRQGEVAHLLNRHFFQ